MFTDTANLSAESRAAIDCLVKGEVIKGVSPTLFYPQGAVTREQTALFLWRVLNWARLAADDMADSSLHLLMDGPATGSGWWRAPRVFGTCRHVVTKKKDGKDVRRSFWAVRGMGGFVMNDPVKDPDIEVVWRDTDPIDIAYCIVPETLWQAYLARRVECGLPREPQYLNPKQSRELVQGEPCMTFGSPLSYESVLSDGIVSKVTVARNETDGSETEWVMTTAAVNPGNSGGILVTFDRVFVGMVGLKPWYSSGFGWGPGDDMGLAIHWRELLKFEKKYGWVFAAKGIVL
jgi:hypothetical protein